MATPFERLERLRAEAPLTQCITNFVSMNIAANVLLAAGASPAMVHSSEEAGEFARLARAVSINIGTLEPDWVEGMKAAIAGARAAGRPWVFDPVACFATGFRRRVAGELLALRPTVLRGNASEIIALGGGASAGQGVDARDPVGKAQDAARRLALASGGVVAVTGVVDYVTDGRRAAHVHGGSALMPKVTALGCALSCLVASFTALEPEEPFEATLAALALYAAAGIEAERGARGPGSFQVAFLDALHGMDEAGMAQARIVEA